MIDSIHTNGGSDFESMSDADCARRLQQAGIDQGERNALFNILIERHHGTVFAIAMRRLRNTHDADQVTQDVFVRFFRKIHQLKDPEHFIGWLKRIATRLSINFAVRNRNKQTALVSHEILDETHAEMDEDVTVELARSEASSAVRRIIPNMKVMDREILVGFYYEGETLIHLSERLRIPVGTVKRRLHTARSNFREALLEVQPDFVLNQRIID